MAVLSLATEPEDCFATLGGVFNSFRTIPVTSTNTTFRNPTNSRVSLSTRRTAHEFTMPLFTPSSEFWFHTKMYIPTETDTTNGVFQFRSAANSNNFQVRMVKVTNTTTHKMQVSPNGSTWNDVGSTFTLAMLTLHTIDVRVKFHATTGALEVYNNGTALMTYAGALVSVNNVADQVLVSAPDSSVERQWSEMVVADESTVGWDVYSLVPNAVGTNVAWANTFAEIDETPVDLTDFIMGSPSEVVTYNFTDIPSSFNKRPARTFVVTLVGQVATGLSGTDIQAAVHTEGVVTPSASLGIAEGAGYLWKQAAFPTQPQTGGNWYTGYLNNMEFGVKAV